MTRSAWRDASDSMNGLATRSKRAQPNGTTSTWLRSRTTDLNAAPGGTAGKAAHYAERAARSALAAFGYEDAVELFDRALTANDLDPSESDRGSLLLGAGEALAASGDTDGARAAFLVAADHARQVGRPAQLA